MQKLEDSSMGNMEEVKKQKASVKFRKWYEKNKEDHNAQRREQYAKDPEVRQKAIANAKRQREQRRKAGPVDTTPIKRNGEKLYRTAQVAELLNKSTETIRGWRRNGWLPESDKRVLYYTDNQVKLLKKLAKVVDEYRYAKDYDDRLNKAVNEIAEKW